MKYFTKELWLGFNAFPDENGRIFKRANKRWQSNQRAYKRQLEKLLPRLSKQAHRFFTNGNLHDGRLLSFIVGDGLNYDIDEKSLFDRNRRKTSVQIIALNYEQTFLYRLRYTKVRRVTFDFPSSEPLFHDEGDHIGDWGYEELTAADNKYFRHEVLFSSGTMFSIEFKHFSYSRLRTQIQSPCGKGKAG